MTRRSILFPRLIGSEKKKKNGITMLVKRDGPTYITENLLVVVISIIFTELVVGRRTRIN